MTFELTYNDDGIENKLIRPRNRMERLARISYLNNGATQIVAVAVSRPIRLLILRLNGLPSKLQYQISRILLHRLKLCFLRVDLHL